MSIKNPKKVHETDDFAIFKGSDGHELKISKKSLSEKLRKELSALPVHAAEGAYVRQPEEFEPGRDYSKAPLPGDVPVESEPPADSQTLKRMLPASTSDQPLDFEPGRDYSKEPLPGDQNATLFPQKGPTPTPPLRTPADRVPTEEAPPQPAAEVPETPPAPVAPTHPVTKQEYAALKEAQVNEILADRLAWQQDLANGHISPQTYGTLFAKKDTLGKIGSLFGLLVSGIGSGLTGQPNAVMEMMNKEIMNDLEAQKQSKTNAQNFIKLNQEKELQKSQIQLQKSQIELNKAQTAKEREEQRLKAATSQQLANLYSGSESYSQALAARDHWLQTQIDQMPEGPKKQKAQQAMSMIAQDTAKRTVQSADQLADQILADPEVAFNKRHEAFMRTAALTGNAMVAAQAKDLQARHFSGYKQLANREIDPADRQALIKLKRLDDSYDDAMKIIKRHTLGTFWPSDTANAKSLQRKISDELGQLSGVSRPLAIMLKNHDARIPDLAGTHITDQDLATVERLKREVAQHRASIFSDYGIGESTQPELPESARAAAEQFLKDNPNHEKADRIKRILGKP